MCSGTEGPRCRRLTRMGARRASTAAASTRTGRRGRRGSIVSSMIAWGTESTPRHLRGAYIHTLDRHQSPEAVINEANMPRSTHSLRPDLVRECQRTPYPLDRLSALTRGAATRQLGGTIWERTVPADHQVIGGTPWRATQASKLIRSRGGLKRRVLQLPNNLGLVESLGRRRGGQRRSPQPDPKWARAKRI